MRSNLHNLPATCRPSCRAFSLVELTIALGIMIVLVSLVIIASATRDTARPRTQQVLSVLKAVADEYEHQTNRRADHGDPDNDFVVNSFSSIERFVEQAMQHDITAQMLRGLRDNLRDDDEEGSDGYTHLEVRDGWGRKVIYRNGSVAGEPFRPSNRPFFVSLGPEGDPDATEQHLYDYDLD